MSILKEISDEESRIRRELRADMRGLLDGYRETDEPAGFQTPGLGYVLGDVPPKTNTSEYLKAAVGWVYSCVSAIADAIARNGVGLYEVKGGGEIVAVEEHPSLDLLDKVNSFTTRYDHFSLSQQYLELTGEAPWMVDRGSSGEGDPTAMMLLMPDRLSLIQNTDRKSLDPIAGFKYKVDANTILDIKRSELVFLKYPDPANMFRGKGTLQAAARTVDLDDYAEDYNKTFFYNAARPDMLLQTDQKLNQKQAEDLRSQVNRLYKGRRKAHSTMILESGLKAQPFSVTQKDMEFLEQQRFSRDKILSIFRVHKSILAITEDVNLANAKVGEYAFAKWTIKPKLERIIAQLNEFYLPMFKGTENMFFAFDDPVPDDVDSKLRTYDSALARGWMTINEVRSAENLEDIGDAGDQLLVPNNLTPIDLAGFTLPGLSPEPVDGQRGILSVRRPKAKSFNRLQEKKIIECSAGGYARVIRRTASQLRLKQEVKQKTAAINEQIDKIASSMVKSIVVQKNKTDRIETKNTKDAKAEYVDSYVKSIPGYEKVFDTTTQLIFENQKRKILKRFKSKAAVDIDKFLLDEEDESQLMVRVYSPLVKGVVVEQGTRAARLVGKARFDLATKVVQDYLTKRAYTFSFEVNQETNVLLANALKQGVAAGEGIPDLTKRVQGVFEAMTKPRAERIARSEVIRASNFAATQAFEQSEVVDKVEWLVTPDDRLCEWCAPQDGKRIDVGGSFFDKGDKVTGNEGGVLDLNYESVDFPPLHPNCRCTVVPIVK